MKTATLVVFIFLLSYSSWAQQTKVLAWQPSDPTMGALVYHPEPILFVHGINANDGGWSTAILSLVTSFDQYYIPHDALGLTGVQGNLNAMQHPYLHTFNYGDYPATFWGKNSNSFEHIEWNAWAEDRAGTSYVNPYTGAVLSAPADGRQTLDERINGGRGKIGIRDAYAVTVNGSFTRSQIVLVAHSMGGVLSHYYLIKSAPDTGVRRLVTMATPHLGSHVCNWLTWWNNANPLVRVVDSQMAGSGILQLRTGLRDLPSTAGFFVHGSRGAVWDLKMVDQRQTTPAHQRGDNPLITYFQNHPAPKLEYVFNVYQRPFIASIGAVSIAINQNPARIESNLGDGVVPLASAAGKTNANDASIWNGDASGSQFVDPVIYGVWPGLDHLSAPSDANSLIKSLDGVPYHWDGNATSDWPAYAHMYGENQSFGKYFKTPSFGSTAYTDEPGIDQMKLYISHPGNPLLIDSKNTWDTGTGLPIKRYTNQTDLVGHQIITGSSSVVQPICTVGVKNHSQTPVASSSAHWIQAGNEYLPASLVVAFQSDSLPLQTNNAYQIVVYVRANGKGFNPDYCLVQYDASGNAAFQYGIGQSQFNFPLSASDNKVFFAAQGCNMAGLVTPQVEQVFNAPVNSETVVAILQKINQGEALSNGCHHATVPTRWTASIREWGTTDTGAITLNFFPTRTSLNIVDAWITNSVFNDYTFTSAGNAKTITINDANAAPSQLIINYTAYLGCDKMFTNSDNGYVPALGKDTLAGVPIDEAFVTQIRTAAKGVFDKYRNIHTNGCVAWTKVDILNRVLSSNEWSTITGHLVTQNHFTELQNVLTELMIEPLTCCCAAVTITPTNLPPAMLNTSYSDNLNAGGGMASYTFAVTSNSLPTGMTYSNADTSMVITGVPTVYGSNTFVITATDTNGCWTNAVCNLFVDCGPVVYLDPALNSETTYELPSGSNNVYYTATINVTNWPSSYAFTYSGALPDGLSTNSTSRSITITGTPTTAGLSAFTLTATDTNGCSTNQTYSITINSGSCLNCSDVYTIDFDWVMNEDGEITSNHCTWIVGNAYTQDCTWLNFFSPACGNLWDMDGPFLTAEGINWDSKWPCSGPSGKTSGSTTCPPGTFAGYFLDCSYGGQTWTINYSNVVVR